MYIRTNPISQTLGTYGLDLGSFAETRSAEERIREEDFQSVLSVLAGPSPWRQFIVPNLRIARQSLPRRPFRIVNHKEFAETMRALGEESEVGHIPGVTNKRTGIITMQEFFGVNSHATYLRAALHETVHLVSHPPGRANRAHSTAWGILGQGLLEGMVECVTLEILNAQRITLARESMRGHLKRLPVAIELLRQFSRHLLGRVLFQGDFQQFVLLMHHTYSVRGWQEIQSLTTANQPGRAIQRMNELSAAQARQRNIELHNRMKQSPARTP
jgi:hypothetical protein